MYGFGGIRYMTYDYDDEEWTDYIKEQGGILDYKQVNRNELFSYY